MAMGGGGWGEHPTRAAHIHCLDSFYNAFYFASVPLFDKLGRRPPPAAGRRDCAKKSAQAETGETCERTIVDCGTRPKSSPSPVGAESINPTKHATFLLRACVFRHTCLYVWR